MLSSLLVAGLLALGAKGQELSSSYDNSTTHQLMKRDPSYVQATRSFQNCVLIDTDFQRKRGGGKYCNSRIQMGECHVNSRIMNQVFAVFIPDSRDPYFGQGGIYGDCCAYDIYPEEGDIAEWENPNYACFTWETPDKKQGKGPPKLPRTDMQPFPILCPSNLHPCYSDHVYDDEHEKMGKYIDKHVTFTGLWNPPKSEGKNGKELWCHWIGGGCKAGTLRDLTLRFIADLQCDISECVPYTQSTKAVDYDAVFPVGTYPPVFQFSFYAAGGIIKGGKPSYGGGQGSYGGGHGGSVGKGAGGSPPVQGGNGKGNNSGSNPGENGKGSSSKGSGKNDTCQHKHKKQPKQPKKPKHKKCKGKDCNEAQRRDEDVDDDDDSDLQRRGSYSGKDCKEEPEEHSTKKNEAYQRRAFKRHIVKRYSLRKI